MNTPIIPVLYQPTSEEIAKVTSSAKQRHPELAGRIDKAASILTTGGLQLDATAWAVGQMARWRIASQSHAGAYIVCGTSCPCEDKRTHCCKHVIAVSLYTKILTNHINANVRARDIDLGILENGEFHAYAKRMGYVQLRKLGSMNYVFADPSSAMRYSMWLAAHDYVTTPINTPLTTPYPTPVTVYVGGTAVEVFA